MAIAVNSSTTGTTTGTSLSFSFTNTAGTYMLLGVTFEGNVSALTATYNGVPMTQIDTDGASPYVYVFELLNPATGSNTVSLSWTTGSRAVAIPISFTGAGGSASTESGSAASDTTNFSTTITLASTDMLVGFGAINGEEADLGVVTGTQIQEAQRNTSLALNAARNTGTGSTSVTWSRGSSVPAAWVGVQVIEPINASVTLDTPSLEITTYAQTITTGSAVTLDTPNIQLSPQAPIVTTPESKWKNKDKSATSSFTNTSKS